MSDVDRWSRTASQNDDPVPDGAPPGWLGKDVNDSLREVMAAKARQFYEPEWRALTYDLAPAKTDKTVTRDSDTQLTIVGCDATTQYPPGARIRVLAPIQGQAHILTSTFTGGNTVITVDRTLPAGPFPVNGVEVHVAPSLPPNAFGEGGSITGDVDLTGELTLENDQPINFKDTPGGSKLPGIKRNASNQLELGDGTQEALVKVDDAQGFKVDTGSGEKQVWHEDNFTAPAQSAEVEIDPLPDLDAEGIHTSTTHSLGAGAKIKSAELECLSADQGWIVGERMAFPIYATEGSTAQCGMYPTANAVVFWTSNAETAVQFWSKSQNTPRSFSAHFVYSRWKLVITVER